MLGSKYNDKKERLENRRQSFFLTSNSDTAITGRRNVLQRPNSDNDTATTTTPGSVTGVRRHTISMDGDGMPRARSLDSGVVRLDSMMNSPGGGTFRPDNPQDDYGRQGRQANNNTPLLGVAGGFGGRSRSMLVLPTQSVCADLSNIDEKPLLDVVDRIEDEVEAHAYEDLVPLEIKLALENRVFGWSHLSSTILGHILYTAGSFLLAFFCVTHLHKFYHSHKHPGQVNEEEWWFPYVRIAVAGFFALSTFRTVRRRRHVWFRAPYGSKEYQRDAARRRKSVRETDQKTLLGRLMRKGTDMMKRRLHKKLSKAQKMFQKRQQRFQKRIKQEEEKKKQLQLQEQNTIPEKEEFQESDLLCSPQSINCYSPCDSFCGGDYDDSDAQNTENSDSTTSDEDDTMEALLNSPSPLQITPELKSSFSYSMIQNRVKKKRCRTFHTRPTTKMESIMHDQILFGNGFILNMPYAHGGFFGAAPFMLANPHWISILRHLMPDVYVEISRRVAYAPASKLIHWAENNPVVAAYGVAHELEFGIHTVQNDSRGHHDDERLRTTPNLEWDVFLDPWLVAQVEFVLQERDKFLSSILPMEHYAFYETHKPLGLSLDDWMASINEAVITSADTKDAGAKIELTESQRQILKYYADRLEERAQTLVDHMLIAHGKLTHLIYEIAGVVKKYNYSRVKRTRRTLGGGIYARQWMAVYAEALKLGLYDDDETISTMTSMENGGDIDDAIQHIDSFMSTSLDALASAKCPDFTIAESVATIQSILRRRGDDSIDAEFPVGLVLDIKSRYIPKRVWACVVDTLRACGVRVVGLASFTVDEIRGISKFCSEPLMEVIFFHSAGDLQRACHDGKIRYGDKVFFNGGSLLWEGSPGLTAVAGLALSCGFDPRQTKQNYRILPFGRTRRMYDLERSQSTPDGRPTITPSSSWMQGSTVELYKERYGLSIGLYCQEFAIDEAAADLLVQLVNENADVYDLGLSWGGVNGLTIRGIQPGRFTSTDGLWNQRYIGALWDSSLYPPPSTSSPNQTPQRRPSETTCTLEEKQQ